LRKAPVCPPAKYFGHSAFLYLSLYSERKILYTCTAVPDMLGNETGLAASIGCTCCEFLNQDLQHLGYACFSGKKIYLKTQLCRHILCKGTGLTASIGCTCVLFYQTSFFLCFAWTGQDLQHQGVHLSSEGNLVTSTIVPHMLCIEQDNSIYRMHLSVLLNQNLQHLGVHLFFGK
jgi:hypothetical protein